eukprot:Tbor_TRINITY_DN3190_c0_g1::TRINITY_DN3190_c0_g1_i1::g.14658::m.14658
MQSPIARRVFSLSSREDSSLQSMVESGVLNTLSDYWSYRLECMLQSVQSQSSDNDNVGKIEENDMKTNSLLGNLCLPLVPAAIIVHPSALQAAIEFNDHNIIVARFLPIAKLISFIEKNEELCDMSLGSSFLTENSGVATDGSAFSSPVAKRPRDAEVLDQESNGVQRVNYIKCPTRDRNPRILTVGYVLLPLTCFGGGRMRSIDCAKCPQDSGHWSLLVLKVTHERGNLSKIRIQPFHFDSLGTWNEQIARKYATFIKHAVKMACDQYFPKMCVTPSSQECALQRQSLDVVLINSSFTERTYFPRQSNGYSCGLYVAAALEGIVSRYMHAVLMAAMSRRSDRLPHSVDNSHLPNNSHMRVDSEERRVFASSDIGPSLTASLQEVDEMLRPLLQDLEPMDIFGKLFPSSFSHGDACDNGSTKHLFSKGLAAKASIDSLSEEAVPQHYNPTILCVFVAKSIDEFQAKYHLHIRNILKE